MAEKKLPGRTRVAVGQVANQERFTIENNLRELCRLAEEAGRKGCDMLATDGVKWSVWSVHYSRVDRDLSLGTFIFDE